MKRHTLGMHLSGPSFIVALEATIPERFGYNRFPGISVSTVQFGWGYRWPDGSSSLTPPPTTYAVKGITLLPPGTPYPEIVERTQAIAKELENPPLGIDTTKAGQPAAELFVRGGLHPEFFNLTNAEAEKIENGVIRTPEKDLVALVAVALQRGSITVPEGIPHREDLFRELQATQAGTPLGGLFIAFALALRMAEEHLPKPFPITPPKFPIGQRTLDYWTRRRRHQRD